MAQRRTKWKICICVAAIVVLCAAGLVVFRYVMYLPQRYDDLKPVQEIGLFQAFSAQSGSCIYEVPPVHRSLVQPFLRPMQSWYGEIILSDEKTDELLGSYDWEEWSVSEKEWTITADGGEAIPYSNWEMFGLNELKQHFVDKNFLICRDFDSEQNQTHRIGQLFSYLDVQAQTILFYYSAS